MFVPVGILTEELVILGERIGIFDLLGGIVYGHKHRSAFHHAEVARAEIGKLKISETVVKELGGLFIGGLRISAHDRTGEPEPVTLGCAHQHTSGSIRIALFSGDAAGIVAAAHGICHGKTVCQVTFTARQIGGRDRVCGCRSDPDKVLVLHRGTHDQGQIVGSGMLCRIGQARRVGEKRSVAAQLPRLIVHHFNEELDGTADMFRNLQAGIVGGSKHDSVQALFHGECLVYLSRNVGGSVRRAGHACPGEGNFLIQRRIFERQKTGHDLDRAGRIVHMIGVRGVKDCSGTFFDHNGRGTVDDRALRPARDRIGDDLAGNDVCGIEWFDFDGILPGVFRFRILRSFRPLRPGRFCCAGLCVCLFGCRCRGFAAVARRRVIDGAVGIVVVRFSRIIIVGFIVVGDLSRIIVGIIGFFGQCFFRQSRKKKAGCQGKHGQF